jgi:hypothetical protein
MPETETAKTETSEPEADPCSGPQHRRLDVFVGRWNKEGRALDSPFGRAANVSAVETYEWLPGGFFLVHRLDGRLGDDPIACIEIIGYDAATGSYPVHSFYDNGTTNVWQSNERDGTWTLTGDWKTGSGSFKILCKTVFDEAGEAMTATWEYSRDGSTWSLFWDTTLTRR